MEMDSARRNQRMNIRNFFLIATEEELMKEIEYRKEKNDKFAVYCLQELLAEIPRYQHAA